jgi:hypothetical protein
MQFISAKALLNQLKFEIKVVGVIDELPLPLISKTINHLELRLWQIRVRSQINVKIRV